MSVLNVRGLRERQFHKRSFCLKICYRESFAMRIALRFVNRYLLRKNFSQNCSCDSGVLAIVAALEIRREPNSSRASQEIGAFTKIFLQLVVPMQSIFIQDLTEIFSSR
ncbi:hypothetical protein KIN20_018245 [Parelaphostrongylus tenuis]|uniref:Uncharacterized protein n=1 Tax=Parelaphostrongylus tenuis TaxID=148309 RepID=A0AAD5MJ57_PARTN|nr:hypothetical protein KIN20_018245 [Parelaphostrongylus tenuis]